MKPVSVCTLQVIFDLDGLLLDSESDYSWLNDALDETLTELGLPVTDEYRSALYPVNEPEFSMLAKEAGLSPESLWERRDANYCRVKRNWIESHKLSPFPEVDSLYALRPTHDLHIISNSPQEIVDVFVATFDYSDLFTQIIGRSSKFSALDELKPAPDFFYDLQETLGSVPEQFVYVGHSDTDEQFAANAGIPYISVNRSSNEDLTLILEQISD
jgi:phosphoglycolate phosphatase